jgi:hypothetical protein
MPFRNPRVLRFFALLPQWASTFEGMVDEQATLAYLLKAREDLIREIVGKMPEQHKKFLISVKEGEIDWSLLDLLRRCGKIDRGLMLHPAGIIRLKRRCRRGCFAVYGKSPMRVSR